MLSGKALITVEEIENLLTELAKSEESIIRKRPSNINEIQDSHQRHEELKRFQLINELYVQPLEGFLSILKNKKETVIKAFIENSDYSICERIDRLRDALIKKGCTPEQILSLVPKTVREIAILVCAKENGLSINPVSTNDKKIATAQNYLNALGIFPDSDLEPKITRRAS